MSGWDQQTPGRPRRNPRRWVYGLLSLLCFNLVADLGVAATRPGDPVGSFDNTRFVVEGNTLLKKAAVNSVLAGFSGAHRSFDDLEHAVEALQKLYRARGFTLVKVTLPEQELNGGVVRLKVMETRLGKVTVAGNVHHSEANIRRSLPALSEGAMLNTDALSENLRIANENPSKQLTLQLQGQVQPSPQPAAVDAVVHVVDEKPWMAAVTLDNSGLDTTGRNQVTAQYQNFDLWGLDHVLSLQYTTATEDPHKVNVYGAGYHIPFYGLSDSLDVYGSYSTIRAGSVAAGLVDLQVSGAGTVYGAHLNHDFARMDLYDSQLTLAFDHKAYRNDVDYAGTQLGGDVTVDPVSVSYVGRWALSSNSANFYLTGVHNVPGGPQGSEADFTAARADSTPNYTLLRYGAGYIRILADGWQVRLSVNGQWTRDALVPGEQFGVGGAASVRGLQERDLSDDKGVTANAELHTPNLCANFSGGRARCDLLTFFDDGHLSRNDALPGEPTRLLVDSAGVGFRLNVDRNLTAQLDYGHVLSATDPAEKGDQRLHALLTAAF
jgi:hemolysin activation/secretion protein